jgi:hypothetical protein
LDNIVIEARQPLGITIRERSLNRLRRPAATLFGVFMPANPLGIQP